MVDADLQSDRDFARKLSRSTYTPVWSLVLLVAFLGMIVGVLLYTVSWVDHTNSVISRGIYTEKLLLDLQTATRGYFLTGDAAFLEPYRKSRPELMAALAELPTLVADNPPQAELAERIAADSRDWTAFAAQTVASVQPGQAKQLQDRMAGGGERFNRVRGDIAAFLSTEYALRDRRSYHVRVFSWSALTAALIATAIASWIQCRGIRVRLTSINATYRQVLSRLRDRNVRVGKLLADLDRELQAVGEIQRSLLPVTLPSIPGIDVAASYQTSQRAGGDYYDFFRLPPEGPDDLRARYGILIADVSGHGTPAAVLMAVTHSIAHGFDQPTLPPNELLNFVNRRLANGYTVNNGSFVTAFYAIYEPDTRRMSYSSAGHNPPRLRRAGEDHFIALDDAQGLPLGVMAEEEYPVRDVQLQKGDTFVLYTDGITEARNKESEFLGVEGLDASFGRSLDVHEMLAASIDAVKNFAGEGPSDDRTLMILRVLDRRTTMNPAQQSVMTDTAPSIVASLESASL